MTYEWDAAKDAWNVEHRGFSFAIVEGFEWETALTDEDRRKEYGERRFVSIGWIGAKLYVVVWAPRGEMIRIISMREATRRERKTYVEET